MRLVRRPGQKQPFSLLLRWAAATFYRTDGTCNLIDWTWCIVFGSEKHLCLLRMCESAGMSIFRYGASGFCYSCSWMLEILCVRILNILLEQDWNVWEMKIFILYYKFIEFWINFICVFSWVPILNIQGFTKVISKS